MLSVEEALARVLAVIPVLGAESVELIAAHGRVLAEPVVSGRDLPPWDNSSMDGYALRAADTAGASAERPVRLRLTGEVAAGAVAGRPVGPGEAYRILTGAPMPPGADTVVPQEEIRREEGAVLVSRPAPPANYLRLRGEDIRTGETVLVPGAVLTPAALGVLAALGRALVRVHQRPRVAILSTGDELVDLATPPGPGQIPNSNTYTLAAQVREAGGIPVNLGIARDSREDLEAHFRAGLGADMLVSTAGVSVGDRDFVREVMEKLGAELDFWKVNMRPGKPLTIGRIAGRPFFGLPGNPVSSMVTFELFVRPALRALAGLGGTGRLRAAARLAEAQEKPRELEVYLRARLRVTRGELVAVPLRSQSSGDLTSAAGVDALAVLPAGRSRLARGARVEAIVLRPPHDA
jgi:molybdopterin molybdotransferase